MVLTAEDTPQALAAVIKLAALLILSACNYSFVLRPKCVLLLEWLQKPLSYWFM